MIVSVISCEQGGHTPLIVAAMTGNLEMCKLLLIHQAEPSMADVVSIDHRNTNITILNPYSSPEPVRMVARRYIALLLEAI